MKKCFCLIIILTSFLMKSQAPARFYTKFGGYGHDIGYNAIQTFKGNYAVVGSTSSFGNGNTDVYLAIVDSMGWVTQEYSYGGFNNDIGRSIIQLSDSGFAITGYTNSFGAGGYDVYVIRVDKNGNLVWQKTFGGIDWDFGYCIKQAFGGGGFVICGKTYSFGFGKSDGYLISCDLNGNFLWQQYYGGAEDDEFKSFVLTYNNYYALAGTTRSMGDIKGDAWLFKTDINGDSIISVKYGNNNKQTLNDIKEHPITKNFYMCGAHDQSGKDTTSAWLLGLDENGIFLFEDYHTYNKIIDEQYYALAFRKNFDYLYVRRNFKTNSDLRIAPMISEFSNNNFISATKYGSTEDDELFSIANTKDKGFVCVGYTKGFNAYLTDVFLLKLDSNSIFGSTSVIGINEVNKYKETLFVFPTLTKGELTIMDESTFHELKINVTDCFGKTVISTNTSNSKTLLNLEILCDGMYFITVSDNVHSKTFKIIKSN
jgi:hypothetical protein